MSNTPTIDWAEAKRLAAQSETMCKLILAAVNGAAADANKRFPKKSAVKIPAVVAAWFGFKVKEIKQGSRQADLAWARQVAIYFCRELTQVTNKDCGAIFGVDHSYTSKAVCVVANRIETEPRTAQDIAELRTHLLLKLK